MSYIVAVDEGTTSTRAMLFSVSERKMVKQTSSPIEQIYPRPSWVEEDANAIYAHTLSCLVETLESVPISEIAGIGITNQRETVIAWDRNTGKPLYNAIIWQCRRTAEYMRELEKTHGEIIRRKTGLVCDAYFSASKIKWLMDNVPEIRRKAELGEVCFGTVDSFLAFKLTEGRAFVTDVTNASRTMLFNINTLDYDPELLELFGIPRNALPKVVGCDERIGCFRYGGADIPLCGIAGDQQSALIGQGCFSAGKGKITYGTGLFMLYNLGEVPCFSENGIITTVAYRIGGKTAYAFEGSVFCAGSAIQWLRDNLNFFDNSAESENIAESVADNGGVYVVPAFTGLGAPYWNADARGMICGLTRGSGIAHITRATLESMAYSVKDLAVIMEKESGVLYSEVRCDGGASANGFLMRFQADLLGVPVKRPAEKESTALGVAFLCGLGTGVINTDYIAKALDDEDVFLPDVNKKKKCEEYYSEWKKAVARCTAK